MEYTSFFTHDDIANRGYDLSLPGKLNLGSFTQIQQAIDDFLQECFDSIYNLIERHNGYAWTKEFFTDMSKTINAEETPRAYDIQQALKWCLVNQTIFILDNGDKNASAKVNNELLGISPKATEKLYNMGILEV